MARTLIRATAAVGVLGLGLLAVSPAAAAGESYQAGASALTVKVADQDGQGTGLSTATYENGKETKSGEVTPAFPQPAQDNFKLGVLVQEATASADGSAACAGLGGSGKGAITIGDSSCLNPGANLNGSLGSLDLGSLLSADSASALTDALSQVPGSATLLAAIANGQATLTKAIQDGLKQAAGQFGDSGLVVDLGLVEGRCTSTGGSASGSTTLTDARIKLSGGGQDITLLDLPTNPDPNTHLTTDLSKVVQLVLDAVKTDLQSSLGGQSAPLQSVIDQIEDPLVSNIHDQVEKNLAPLEQNVLDVTLNYQDPYPATDSIKVRALDVKVLPALASQLKGNPLLNVQIGDAACAPVAQAAEVSPPQADTPVVSNPKTPTAVSSGLASVPGQQQGLDATTWALVALAGLGLVGAGLAGARRFFG